MVGGTRTTLQLTGTIKSYPARVLAIWHVGIILLGTALLWQPICLASGANPVTLIDAVFTSTSATCVTGLVVRSTPHDFSFIGQVVILLLIQIGGVGVMTLTSYVILSMGRPASLRDRAVLVATMGADHKVDLESILRQTLIVTAVLEAIGFAILAVHNLVAGMPWQQGIWEALFHSVSAFCNAGFALHDDSLMRYEGNIVVNLTLMGLVVMGGLGFPVILDLRRNFVGPARKGWQGLTLHSKLMLLGTGVLIAIGTLSFLMLEWGTALHDMEIWKRPLVAMFHSVSCRTAGFNTVQVAGLTNAMLFVSVLLMLVGAGPGSTAGGFKVSTLAILVLRAWTSLRGRDRVNIFRRTIPAETVTKAIVTAVLFAATAVAALTILLAFEQSREPHVNSKGMFLDAVFEVTSALATVGLSTGMTENLSHAGKLIITILMFIGRLGPITVFTALSKGEQREPIEYSNEEPLIG